jgi:hypothetical protein
VTLYPRRWPASGRLPRTALAGSATPATVIDPTGCKGPTVYIVAWLHHRPATIHEVLRIEAATPDELLAGTASALRKKRIKPSHELAILQCPPGEAAALRANLEELMQQTDPSDDD